MANVYYDFASLYPNMVTTLSSDPDAVLNLLQERLNHKKMENRLRIIDNLLNEAECVEQNSK